MIRMETVLNSLTRARLLEIAREQDVTGMSARPMDENIEAFVISGIVMEEM